MNILKSAVSKCKAFWQHFLSVRKTIALLLTMVFCYLSITGKINQQNFVPIFTMIIGYYFGKTNNIDDTVNSNENKEDNK